MSTKYSRRKRYPEFMAFIASLPCAVCGKRPVEVAHVGHRGFGQKCSDLETIPLCAEHHRTGKDSAHVLGRRFWEYHQLDRDELIGQLQHSWNVLNEFKEQKDGIENSNN